jgi:DNA-binding beta-propeller fold protein YncE
MDQDADRGRMMKLKYAIAPISLTFLLSACAGIRGSDDSQFLSVQDGRSLLVDGVGKVGKTSDTLAIVELKDGKLRLHSDLVIPTSLVGPPASIAVLPDKKYALVTAATKLDPTDPNKIIPSDVISLVSLGDGKDAIKVVDSISLGSGPSGLALSRNGALALVPNRVSGSISVVEIKGQKLTEIQKIAIGDKSGPSQIVITPDGRRALLTRDGDNQVSILDIDGKKITLNKKTIYAGLKPYGIDISPSGKYAVVGNLGGGQGDADTISLIDLSIEPPRVIDTATVGQTPEGISFSSAGHFIGITVVNGSNKPKSSPYYSEATYKLFGINNGKLEFLSEVKGGQWLQGQAFTPDDRYVLVQDALNQEIRLYKIDGKQLSDTGERLKMKAAPAALRYWK